MSLVRVERLSVDYRVHRRSRRVVNDVTFDIEEGESFGLVGESGSGKSTIALALTRYLPAGMAVAARRLEVASSDLLSLRGDALRRYRRHDIGMVFQEPARALNPTATIGAQIAEVQFTRGDERREARRSVLTALEEVGFEYPDALARRYPHELSGGQQQRAMIAMALEGRPRLIILDEPTTALDSVAQSEILALLDRLQNTFGFASLLISHDLALVTARCDRIGVVDAGHLVQTASTTQLLTKPTHPRARELVFSADRSRDVTRRSSDLDSPDVVVASAIGKRFGANVALKEVYLNIRRGETLAVVGETGSGKTTLGRVVAGLTPHSGHLVITAPSAPPPVQMIFQSPDASLNPRRTVRQTLQRSIQLLGGEATPVRLLEGAGLSPDLLDRLPHELSGGQKQRVAIARAFAGRSPIIICDEPTSALDANVSAAIIDLLIELQESTGVSYLFISHDLSVISRIAHRVAVMQHGRIIETAQTSDFFRAGRNAYSQRLINAARAAVPEA